MTKQEKNRIACRAYYKRNRNAILKQKREAHINYFTWKSMIQRCTNKNRSDYKYYGSRGIKVCERWLNSFELFSSDMGDKPTKLHTIDRKDVNGNYELSNCRWATRAEQIKNRRV